MTIVIRLARLVRLGVEQAALFPKLVQPWRSFLMIEAVGERRSHRCFHSRLDDNLSGLNGIGMCSGNEREDITFAISNERKQVQDITTENTDVECRRI